MKQILRVEALRRITHPPLTPYRRRRPKATKSQYVRCPTSLLEINRNIFQIHCHLHSNDSNELITGLVTLKTARHHPTSQPKFRRWTQTNRPDCYAQWLYSVCAPKRQWSRYCYRESYNPSAPARPPPIPILSNTFIDPFIDFSSADHWQICAFYHFCNSGPTPAASQPAKPRFCASFPRNKPFSDASLDIWLTI